MKRKRARSCYGQKWRVLSESRVCFVNRNSTWPSPPDDIAQPSRQMSGGKRKKHSQSHLIFLVKTSRIQLTLPLVSLSSSSTYLLNP